MEKKKRLGRGSYYLAILEAVRARSTCDRGMAGAIIVKDNRLISAGYVGAPAGDKHCDDIGHLMEYRTMVNLAIQRNTQEYSTHCIRTVHAELNAILQAARFGIAVEGATMYCTMMPCYECAKAIVNAGIKKVIAVHPYQNQQRSIFLFRRTGLAYYILKKNKLY